MQNSLMNRLMGVITFKAPIYREIAEDASAMQPAVIIVVVVSVISGLISGVITGNIVSGLLTSVLGAVIGWIVGGLLTSVIANALGGKTNTSEMLRIFGHIQVFQIIGFIPCVGTIAALVLGIIGNVLAIREAAELDNTKAIVVAILVAIAIFVVATVIGLIFGVGAGVLGAAGGTR